MVSKWFMYDQDHNIKPAPQDPNTGLPSVDYFNWLYGNDGKNKIVGRTEIGKHMVSTVFLGLDHQFIGRDPLLFETMVFLMEDWDNVDGKKGLHEVDGYSRRYHTWDEAKSGHEDTVKSLTSGYSREELEEAGKIIGKLLDEGDTLGNTDFSPPSPVGKGGGTRLRKSSRTKRVV